MDATQTVTASLVDICLPCYLLDSYSREGQCLTLAPLGLSADETVDALLGDFNSAVCDIPWTLNDDELRAAFRDALQGVNLRGVDADGNRVDEPTDDDDCDGPYVYVVVEW